MIIIKHYTLQISGYALLLGEVGNSAFQKSKAISFNAKRRQQGFKKLHKIVI